MSATPDLTPDPSLDLEPLRAMLAADGYALAVDLAAAGGTIVLDITATADACAECLAPAGVIAAVARSCMPEGSALADREIDVRLPAHGAEPAELRPTRH
jgi:hypothetical protein